MASTLFALLRNGVRLLLFAAILLAGIQIPAFVTQYEQRVDAHFSEVSSNISGFQNTADLMFDGDLDALVQYYRSSGDPVFVSDADSLATIVSRYRRFSAESQALNGNAFSKALHVLLSSDPEILRETTRQYSYTIPLTGAAIIWGLSLALLVIVCVECVVLCGRFCRRRLFKRGKQSDSPVTGHGSKQVREPDEDLQGLHE